MKIKELKDDEIKEEHKKEIADSYRILGANVVMTPDGNIIVAIECSSAVIKIEQLSGVERGYIEELTKKILSDPMRELALEITELHKKCVENAFNIFMETLDEKFAGGTKGASAIEDFFEKLDKELNN